MRLGAYIFEVYNTTKAATHEEFLIKLLEGAVEARELERQNRYLRQADFILYKTFDKFSFENIQLPEALTVGLSLKQCDFLKEGHNLILYGARHR